MPFFTRPYLNDDQFQQILTDTLTLNGETNFAGVLKSKGIEIDASTGVTISIGDVLTLDSDGVIRLKSSSSGNTSTYQGASPSTITVGGIPANTTLTGKTFQDLWQDLLVVYQKPSFTIFKNTISALNEVGNPASWSGVKTFTWSISNDNNVEPNTIEIIDTLNPIPPLGDGLANDGEEDLDLGITIINNVPISYTWGINGTNTELDPISQKNYTIKSIYPWFYGTYPSYGGTPGSNRPDPTVPGVGQTLINGGTAMVANSVNTIIVNNFNATVDDYLWFATPSSSGLKFSWYTSAFSNGSIGGVVGSSNKFPTPILVDINSPNGYWTGVQYYIYVSNQQDPATYMEFS